MLLLLPSFTAFALIFNNFMM
ncbi:hypothetical protein L195_g051013, partial [Trifolium pratense]